MNNEDRVPGTFLERWSRRKRGLEPEAELETESIDAGPSAEPGAAEATAGSEEECVEPVVEKDFADFDFEELDYDSDYKQFMEKDVSPEARHKALRKLWVSNPILCSIDGLDDYCEDYTDAAVCLPKGTMKTLYRYGRGFLDDDEVAAWEALGKESKDIADAEAAERRAAAAAEAEAATSEEEVAAVAETETGDVVAETAAEADTDPGAACADAVKQDEADMLAEFESETSDEAVPRPGSSPT